MPNKAPYSWHNNKLTSEMCPLGFQWVWGLSSAPHSFYLPLGSFSSCSKTYQCVINTSLSSVSRHHINFKLLALLYRYSTSIDTILQVQDTSEKLIEWAWQHWYIRDLVAVIFLFDGLNICHASFCQGFNRVALQSWINMIAVETNSPLIQLSP